MRSAHAYSLSILLIAQLAHAQQTPVQPPGLTQQVPQRPPIYQTVPPIPQLSTKAQHEANFDAESQQANALFTAGEKLESLPLYEDLCRQDPTVPLFAERHAAALIAKFSAPSSDQKAPANALIQAYNELHRAQGLGDNDSQIVFMIAFVEKSPVGAILTGIPLTVGYTYPGTPAAQAEMRQAEAAFSAQKFDEGAKLYAAAAAEDPAYYTAALFTGDAYFRAKAYANAGLWFAKAIAIDPDRETAYRYWGDALYRAGDPAASRLQYVKAYVAEPYNIAAQNALGQWATVTKTPVTVPQVRRPQFYLLNGKVDFDPHVVPETGDGLASWLVYQRVRVSHGAPTVTQIVPPGGSTMANGEFNAAGYIHTLAEEMDALTTLLADVKAKLAAGTVTPEKLDPGLKVLLQLHKDNMLECMVLLNMPDMGLRHDYAKFRAAHRDLLAAYVDRYLLNQPAAAPASSH